MIEMTTDFAADGAVCILDKALAVSDMGFAHQPAHDYSILWWLSGYCYRQCSGSMPFWGGSGSADPCLWIMDPDPAIFVIDLQDASKLIFNTIFSASYFLMVHLHHFSKIKSQKESQNRRNQGFSYYFCMMIEGSGSGSIPLTSGSGSGSQRPKNMWIRIRNNGYRTCLSG